MKYPKPALSFADQAALLQARGLVGGPAVIAERLASVSYYRLSAYWYPEIPIQEMGFPADWKDSPIWQP